MNQNNFYGLENLDEKIANYVDDDTGTFVELGAFDGISQNNTLYFEEKGWRGVLIEPIPENYEKCLQNRPLAQVFNCACKSFDDDRTEISMRYSGLMSLVCGVKNEKAAEDAWVARGEELQNITSYSVTVPARTLSSVLDEAGISQIDLLILDVEGFELDVLEGLDFGSWRPRYIVAEDTYNNDIIEYLKKQDYRIVDILVERNFTRDILYSDNLPTNPRQQY